MDNEDKKTLEDIKKIDDTLKSSFSRFHSTIREYGKVGIENYFKNLSKNAIVIILMLLTLLTIVFLSYYDVFYMESNRMFTETQVKVAFYLPLTISLVSVVFIIKPKYFFKTLYTIIPVIIGLYTVAFFSPIEWLSFVMIILLGLCFGLVISSLIYVFLYYFNSKEKLLGSLLIAAFICAIYLITKFLQLIGTSILVMRYIIPVVLFVVSYVVLLFKPEKDFDDIVDQETKLHLSSLIMIIGLIGIVFINEGIFQGIRANIEFNSMHFSNNAYSLGFIVSIIYIVLIYIFTKNSNYIMIFSYFVCIIGTYELGILNLLYDGAKFARNVFEGAMGITSPIGIVAGLMTIGKVLEDNRSIKYLRILTISIGIAVLISKFISVWVLNSVLRNAMTVSLFIFLIFFGALFIMNIRSLLGVNKPSVSATEEKEETPYINPDDVLTKKEKVVFELLLEGLTLRQIAGELACKYDAVNFHYKNIYRKLEVNSKIELIIRYGKNN